MKITIKEGADMLSVTQERLSKVLLLKNRSTLARHEYIEDLKSLRAIESRKRLNYLFGSDFSELSEDDISFFFTDLEKLMSMKKKILDLEEKNIKMNNFNSLSHEYHDKLYEIHDTLIGVALSMDFEVLSSVDIFLKLLLSKHDNRVNYIVNYLGKMNNTMDINKVCNQENIYEEIIFESLIYRLMDDELRNEELDKIQDLKCLVEQYKDRVKVRQKIMNQEF